MAITFSLPQGMPDENATPAVETATSTAKKLASPKYGGPDPWTVGGLFGGTVGAIAGGPIGLLVGLGYGLLAKQFKQNTLDQQTAYMQARQDETDAFSRNIEELRQTYAGDDTTLHQIDLAERMNNAGYERQMTGQEGGEAKIDAANAIIAGIYNATQQKKESALGVQRQIIGDEVKGVKDEYARTVSEHEDIDAQATRVLGITSGADFDPNSSFNKAMLANMLSASVGGYYKDDASAAGAISQGIRSIPVVGAVGSDIAAGISTYLRSKDAKLTREDYNRFALNLKDYAAKTAQTRMERLGNRASGLNDAAAQIGLLPEGMSVHKYVTGDVDEFTLLPVPTMPRMEPKTAEPPPHMSQSIPFSSAHSSISPVRQAQIVRMQQWQQQQQGLQSQQESQILLPTN